MKNNKTAILLTLILLAGAVSYLLFYQKSQRVTINIPQLAPSKTVIINPDQDLLSELEKRLAMPKGKPAIFNISDLSHLTSQNFFNGSKPTDKLILFQEDKKAVIYDPIAKQIINVGPLVVMPATPAAKISGEK